FGARDEAGRPLPQPSRADDKGLLDAALDDAHDLSRKLGRADKQKLEEYLDAVRGVERRLGYSARRERWKPPTQAGRLPPPPKMDRPDVLFTSRDNGGDAVATHDGKHIDPPELVRLMLDMIVLAFWTDTTRNATFLFANDVSTRSFSFLEG